MVDARGRSREKSAYSNLKIENDEHFEKRKQKQVNNGKKTNLQQLVEPAELTRFHFGDDLVTVLPPEYDAKAKSTHFFRAISSRRLLAIKAAMSSDLWVPLNYTLFSQTHFTSTHFNSLTLSEHQPYHTHL